jgi:hypothetical protein
MLISRSIPFAAFTITSSQQISSLGVTVSTITTSHSGGPQNEKERIRIKD